MVSMSTSNNGETVPYDYMTAHPGIAWMAWHLKRDLWCNRGIIIPSGSGLKIVVPIGHQAQRTLQCRLSFFEWLLFLTEQPHSHLQSCDRSVLQGPHVAVGLID